MHHHFQVTCPSLDEVCRAAVVAALQASKGQPAKAASLLAGGLRALKNAF